MNCHYVSRFLTKPWETQGRQLTYFDFSTGKIDSCSSEYLFSRENSNTADQENFLNRFIETPLGEIQKIADGDLKNLKWRVFRAMYLLFMYQAPRYFGSQGVEFADFYEFLFSVSEASLDGYISEVAKDFSIMKWTIPSREEIFFPELGVFPIPVKTIHPSIIDFALCIPVTTKTILALTPNSADKTHIENIINSEQVMMSFSIGIVDFTDKVVIPPNFIAVFPESDLIQGILKSREKCSEYMSEIVKAIKNIDQIMARIGVKPRRTSSKS